MRISLIYYRRKILLNIIAAFGNEGIEKLKLQKILFLLSKQQENPAFSFVPYKYGCYSFQATKDLEVMTDYYTFIAQHDDKWFPRQVPDSTLHKKESMLLSALINQFKHKDKQQTIDYVYDRYPYYSINSQWPLSDKQKNAVEQVRLNIKSNKHACLFTIGYEGKSIDAYLNELIRNNITLLCDVRKNSQSMKYGFSKNQLKKYCSNLGIAYEHIPELGIASQKRQSLISQQDYQSLFNGYKAELPEKQRHLQQVVDLMRAHPRLALTCFEKGHEECHRHCVSDYLQEKHLLKCRHL
ncbi:MAG: DUF488 domain-containing protein [Parvibaculales bacterium]